MRNEGVGQSDAEYTGVELTFSPDMYFFLFPSSSKKRGRICRGDGGCLVVSGCKR